MRQQLTNDDGRAALTAAGFRLPDAEATGPGVPGMPSGAVTYLPDPSAAQQAAMVKTDAACALAGREERRCGRETAVTIFPNTSQVGLWTFGIDRGGPGQDWSEVVPIRHLDEAVGGKPQRQVLGEALPGLVASAGGGTGLYDSLLAAYKHMVSTFVPGRVNSVILLTDGRNDDTAGVSLEQLLGDISALKDPNKPVVIVTVGMGQDVDTSALSAVSSRHRGQDLRRSKPAGHQPGVHRRPALARLLRRAVCTSR